MQLRADGPRWFDSHCHLQDRYLPQDEGDVRMALEACTQAGVGRLVCVGTDAESSLQALSLAGMAAKGGFGQSSPEIWATAGLHPHEAATGTVESVRRIVEDHCPRGGAGGSSRAGHASGAGRSSGAVASEGVGGPERVGGPGDVARSLVAVGECGLDYYYEHSPRDVQREVFAAQVQLAHEYQLALVIHARDAWDDLFGVLIAEGVPQHAIIHCFTGGPIEARRALDLGMWLSFSGIVTFKNAVEIREAAALCPVDRLLVETDSPFLAPVPYRGRPNQPAFVPLIGQAIASARGEEVHIVAEASWQAGEAAFRQ